MIDFMSLQQSDTNPKGTAFDSQGKKKKITTFIHKAQIHTKYTNKYIMNTDIKILQWE